MRLSKNGLIAIAFGAVIFAATLISPALGGPSLKKLVKKEVAKQIANATGPPGANGINGVNGVNGVNGADGTARAYARVRQHGGYPCAPACTFDRSKGIAGVTHPTTGTYCVDAPAIDPASVPAAVTVEFGNSSSPEGNASAQALVEGSSCPSGQFQVQTERQPPTVVRNAAGDGTVEVAGNAVPADNVAFTIVIP